MWWEMLGFTREGGSSEGLGDYSEDHGALVDAELGAAEVVVCVSEHVVRLELGPLHLLQVETPYDCHVGDVVEMSCSSVPREEVVVRYPSSSCDDEPGERADLTVPDGNSNVKEVTGENSADRQLMTKADSQTFHSKAPT